MRNTIRFTLVAGALALVAALTVPALMAQGGPPQGAPMGRGMGPGGPGAPRGGPGGPGGPGFGLPLRELNLSDAQRDQVRSIMESHQAEFKQVGDKMRAAREGMGDLIEADSFDEAAVRAKAAEIGAAEADQAVLSAKVRSEIFSILTDEQQLKAKELRGERQARRQQMQQQMKQRRQGRQQRH